MGTVSVEESRPERRMPAELAAINFSHAPFIVIWEVTRACDLACVHCRAEAVARRHPLELTTDEGRRLLEQIREVGHPLVVLTGGDPIKRPDICDFIAYGDQIGLRMTITPSGTPLMTPAVIDRLKAAGLVRMAVSLDGSTAAIHDDERRGQD
ncbi:MAG: radical SAM protein [Candidatus Binatia bacterium]